MKSLLLVLFLIISSCAQKPKVEPWSLSDGTPDSSLLVMDVNLNPGSLMSAEHECEIVARYHDGTEMKLKIRPGNRRYFWSAPQGRYELMMVRCGMFTRFDMSEYPSFTVKDGEAYYFGLLEMALEDRENLSWGIKDLGANEFLVQFLSLPENLKHKIFSPFTRKQITESLIKATPVEPEVSLKGYSELASQWQTQWPLTDCLLTEKKTNPLRAGLYQIELNRRYGRAVIKENAFEEHLYSKEFQDCAMEVMQKIEFTAAQGDVQILLKL